MKSEYELLGSGDERKCERFGSYKIIRPCPQALWKSEGQWEADAEFTRADGWSGTLPRSWEITHLGVRMKLSATDFGHLGIFPEHGVHANWLVENKPKSVLNLFAYSGLLTLVLAKSATVTHLDAAKGMVSWARENAELNGISSVRWIVDDAMKFLSREARRESRYDMIILDPPTFGRGAKGEVFKIERDLMPLLNLCFELQPSSILLSAHTPGVTPRVLEKVLPGSEVGETLLGEDIPSGTYARWQA